MKLRFSAAGTNYSDFVKDDMIPGTQVELIDEPENPYDSNAVYIRYNGKFVGYVPANLTLSKPILDAKPFTVAKVTDYGFELIEN